MNNRLANTKNIFQGDRKKVLCVCSAGLLRSPTAAWILSNKPFGFNTRACGANPEFALVPLDEALVFWADEVVCMSQEQVEAVLDFGGNKKVHLLNVPDNFGFRDETLVEIMEEKLSSIFNIKEE